MSTPRPQNVRFKDDIAKEHLERLFGGMWPAVLGQMAVAARAEAVITMPVTIINVGSKRDDSNEAIDYGIWVMLGKGRIFIPWSLIKALEPLED
jgi:hypothetical protein